MGCDIHMLLEKKHNNKWVGIHKVNDYSHFGKNSRPYDCSIANRDYEFFGLLANVRTEGPTPKGFPIDASEFAIAEKEAWGSDGHSWTSYYLVDFFRIYLAHTKPTEFAAARLENEELSLYLAEFPQLFVLEYVNNIKDLNIYRMIIWFDN